MPYTPPPSIPKRITKLPKDSRGYPIPFVTFIDPHTGVPDFRTLDLRRQMRCIQHMRCGICGEALGKFIAFIGGPKCGIYRTFIDPPMHRECAEFAAQVCPFITRENATYREVPEDEIETLAQLGILKSINESVPDMRDDPRMFIYITESYQPVKLSNAEIGSLAAPFIEVVQIKQHRSSFGVYHA